MATKKTVKNLKFEEALAELEAAVEKLENGDLPLEDAITEFQRGTELSKICLEKLNAGKGKMIFGKKTLKNPTLNRSGKKVPALRFGRKNNGFSAIL